MNTPSIAIVVLAGLFSAGLATAEPLPPQKVCQQDKVLAMGNLRACLLKSQAAVRGGKTDRSADCRARFDSGIARADRAANEAGTSCRFVDYGNGSVGDLNSGLVWEQKVAGSGCPHCADDTYNWSNSASPGVDGTDADGGAYSAFLNALDTEISVTGYDVATPCFTGHCDWRLPTIEELNAIVVPGLSPSLDPVFGPVKAGRYWSSTTNSADVSTAWTIDLTQPGSRSAVSKVSPGIYVLAVRGGVL